MPLALHLVPGRSALCPGARLRYPQVGRPHVQRPSKPGLYIRSARHATAHYSAPQPPVDQTSGGHKGLRLAQGIVCVMDHPNAPRWLAPLCFVTAVVVVRERLVARVDARATTRCDLALRLLLRSSQSFLI